MASNNISNAIESASSWQYESTLMYGKYTEDLARTAKLHAKRQSQLNNQQRDVPISRSKKKKMFSCWKSLKKLFLKYASAEWIFLLLLGIIMAFLSFLIDWSIQKCQDTHYWVYTELQNQPFLQYLAWVTFPIIFVVFSVGFVQIVSPQAVGSGIPEMKTIMRGVVLHEYLSFRVLLAKMIGLTASLGSRLPIGKEGPFVHIASIVATLLNKLFSRVTTPFENESRKSEMLAAACAVGIASNFAAPIGGVLFSIEVTAIYFAVKNYWRGFFSAVCGAFAFRLLAVWNAEEETITALFKTNFRVTFPYDLQELIAFSSIGVVCGFAGALFVYLHRALVDFIRTSKCSAKLLLNNKFLYPVIVSLVISSLTFPRGLGQVMAGELTLKQAVDTLFDNRTWAKLGYIDESDVIVDVQEGWKHPSVNIFVTLVIFIIVHFVTTIFAITLPVPCGVFMPVFLTGAAFGRLVGESMAAWYPDGFYEGDTVYRIVPGGYAVVGAASLAGAVTHTISTAVIVFELTGQISHILPVMIAVLIANAIAQWLQPSIYESIIEIKDLPYLPELNSTKKKFYKIFVSDFMQKDVQFISYSTSYKALNSILETSQFKSYPLVDSPKSMILIGSVQRGVLETMLRQSSALSQDTAVQLENAGESDRFINAHSVVEQTHDDGNWQYDQYSENVLNFEHCQIDPAPFQLVEHTSLFKAHTVFSLLGLQLAYVTSVGKLIGLVTLKELRYAIHNSSWRRRLDTLKNPLPSEVDAAAMMPSSSSSTSLEDTNYVLSFQNVMTDDDEEETVQLFSK